MESRAERKHIHTKYSNESLSGHIQAIHKVIRSTHTATECRNERTVTANERLKYEDIITQPATASSMLARMSVQNTHTHTHADAAMRDERKQKRSAVDHTLTHTQVRRCRYSC